MPPCRPAALPPAHRPSGPLALRPPCRLAALAVLAVVAGCNPNTTRPPFGPLPMAIEAELELPVAVAVQVLTEALREDSIPVDLIHERDGYLETSWFGAGDGIPTTGRPLGVEIVRVRAWATPGRVGHTELQIEAVYRPMADPSRAPRELDRLISPDHPVYRRLDAAVIRLVTQFGHPEQLPPRPPPAARPDSTVRPDTTARPDTIPAIRGRPRTVSRTSVP